ncbi:MAG: alpha-ketoglutarate-dependent dioxygenase AlkB [Acinetobacter sp.]
MPKNNLEQENVHLNLLPYDGTVLYFGQILPPQHATLYFNELLSSIAWKHDEAIIYGKHITTKRKVAWYGDHPFSYTYSKTTKHALAWNPVLLELKKIVEGHSHETFNSCLLNLYHDGDEGMAWHSDGETDLRKNGAIASLSFGAERKFAFKHKTTKEKIELFLAHGSLLLMKDTTQTYWLHCLPPSKRITSMRINLTFRQIEHSSN